jgi:hypothetical protein
MVNRSAAEKYRAGQLGPGHIEDRTTWLELDIVATFARSRVLGGAKREKEKERGESGESAYGCARQKQTRG